MKQHERPDVIRSAKRKVCAMICEMGSQSAVARELDINSGHISKLVKQDRLSPLLMEKLQVGGLLEVPSSRYRVSADFRDAHDIAEFRNLLKSNDTTLTELMNNHLERSRLTKGNPRTNDEIVMMCHSLDIAYSGYTWEMAERVKWAMLHDEDFANPFMDRICRDCLDMVEIAKRLMDHDEVLTAAWFTWKEYGQ